MAKDLHPVPVYEGMLLTDEILKEYEPCVEGLRMFRKLFPDGVILNMDTLNYCVVTEHLDDAGSLFVWWFCWQTLAFYDMKQTFIWDDMHEPMYDQYYPYDMSAYMPIYSRYLSTLNLLHRAYLLEHEGETK